MTHRFTYGLAAVPIGIAVLGSMPAQAKNDQFMPVPTIAFSNTIPNVPPNTLEQVFNSAEIYLIDPDGTHPRQLTDNQASEPFATLSPDGKKIVFESNRLRDEENGEPVNTWDLFVMNTDGTEQQHLIRGGSPTWSPDSKQIAFHASASGTGLPINATPGAPTSDSDIFVANVDDLLTGVEPPRNVTNTNVIDDDPDWSPDGQTLVYTRHDVIDGVRQPADIYKLSVDGSDAPQRLTSTDYEERAADFSPDGTRIVFMCTIEHADFELCLLNADSTGETQQLTFNTVGDLGPNWSPDGHQIVFQRNIGGGQNQLFVIDLDDVDPNDPTDPDRVGTQITGRPGDEPQGYNGGGSWDRLRVKVGP